MKESTADAIAAACKAVAEDEEIDAMHGTWIPMDRVVEYAVPVMALLVGRFMQSPEFCFAAQHIAFRAYQLDNNAD